jgi:hypothetical protein
MTVDEYDYEPTGEETKVTILSVYLLFLRLRFSNVSTVTSGNKLEVIEGGKNELN